MFVAGLLIVAAIGLISYLLFAGSNGCVLESVSSRGVTTQTPCGFKISDEYSGLDTYIALEVEKVKTVTESKNFNVTMMVYYGITIPDNKKTYMRGILRKDLDKLGITDTNTNNRFSASASVRVSARVRQIPLSHSRENARRKYYRRKWDKDQYIRRIEGSRHWG